MPTWITPADAPARCDAVVIGAGIAGSVVAADLAAAGLEVVVISARRGGGAAALLGHVEIGVLEHPHRTVAALGEARAAELFAFARRGAQRLEDDGLLSRCGGWWIALDAREATEIDESVAALTRLGHPAVRVEVLGVHARFGGALGPALHLPDDGVVNPDEALAAYQARAEQHGAVFVAGLATPAYDDAGGAAVLVGGRRIEAELAILSAGHQTDALDPALEGRLTPIREQVVTLATPAPPPGRAGQGWTSFQPDADGLALMGARWATPHLEVGEREAMPSPRVLAKLEGFAEHKLGRPAAVRAHRAGVTATTPDGLPIIGPLPGDRRRVVLAGFGSAPWALAVAGAEAVARGLTTGDADVPDLLASRRLVRWRRATS